MREPPVHTAAVERVALDRRTGADAVSTVVDLWLSHAVRLVVALTPVLHRSHSRRETVGWRVLTAELPWSTRR